MCFKTAQVTYVVYLYFVCLYNHLMVNKGLSCWSLHCHFAGTRARRGTSTCHQIFIARVTAVNFAVAALGRQDLTARSFPGQQGRKTGHLHQYQQVNVFTRGGQKVLSLTHLNER